MTTAIAKAGASSMGLISRETLRGVVGNVANSMKRVATGGVDFLKMDKKGRWTYGQDEEAVSPDSIWAINPGTLEHGWIAWAVKLGQEPLGELMVSASRPLPDVATLPPVKEGKGYQQQYGVELLCVAGPNEGAHVLYKQTSVGGTKLFNKYIDELYARVEGDVDELIAMVSITSESYDHKEFKETFNPIFEYLAWNTPDDLSIPGQEADAPADTAAAAPAEAPRKRRSKAEMEAARAAEGAAAKAAAEAEADEQDDEQDEQDEVQGDYQEDGQDPDGGDEDDEDAQIAALLAAKEARKKAAAAAAAAAAAPADAPRRRERR